MAGIRKGRWRKFETCRKCHLKLSTVTQIFNDFVCPHCGNNDVFTNDVIVRKVYTKPWYYFWQVPEWEGRDEYSDRWLSGEIMPGD